MQPTLWVVDNGSSDETAQVVKSCALSHIPVRYTREDQPGLSRGRNHGLAKADGEVIAFVDDDIRLPAMWLSGLCEPMIQRKASVVAGGVRLAPHLLRPWMTPRHRSYLASSEWLNPDSPHGVVGANMAFSRDVLRRVPGFDPELGAGALGFGEEELFGLQLSEAGYKIFGRLDVCVEHHFHASRLKRESWLASASKRGAVNAYLTYHWYHRGYKAAWLRLWGARCQLSAWRARFASAQSEEGCAEREMDLLYRCGELRFFLDVRGCSRHYEYRGLTKLSQGR